MILKASAEGFLIPKGYLPGIDEIDVRLEGGRIVVVPVAPSLTFPAQAHDCPVELDVKGRSIFELLGSDPFEGGPPDGAERHDFYIVGGPHGEPA